MDVASSGNSKHETTRTERRGKSVGSKSKPSHVNVSGRVCCIQDAISKGRVNRNFATPGNCRFPINMKSSRDIAACFLHDVSCRLLAAAKTEHQVKSRFLLDVVVRQSPAVLELLTSKDETLLVWGNALLVLDLRLHVVDGV